MPSTKKILMGSVAFEEDEVDSATLSRYEIVKSLPEKLMLCGWTMRVVGAVAMSSGRIAMGCLRGSRVVILMDWSGVSRFVVGIAFLEGNIEVFVSYSIPDRLLFLGRPFTFGEGYPCLVW